MPLIDAVIAVCAVSIVWLWATLKLVKWSLNADAPEVRGPYVSLIYTGWKATLGVIIVLELGPPVGRWTIDVWHVIVSYL